MARWHISFNIGIHKESAHELGKCVVVVTHSNEVAKQADMVLSIKHGKLDVRNP